MFARLPWFGTRRKELRPASRDEEENGDAPVMIPDHALFRVGQLSTAEEYERLVGEKLELWSGVLTDVPPVLCWPPRAAFTHGQMLSEANYQALTFPPGWQTELYRGVVLAWTEAEAEDRDLDLDGYREQAKRWIDQHTSLEA